MPNTTVPESNNIIINDKPTHPNDFKVVREGTPEMFSSRLVAERAFSKGAVIARLEGLTPGEKRYSTVQISETKHIELNSDLVFMNHSCDPSTCMDVDRLCVIATRDLVAGDELNFFYPSTEWDMAQPFACWCGSSKCIETVQGAHYLPTEVLQQFELSQHIRTLLQKRDAA